MRRQREQSASAAALRLLQRQQRPAESERQRSPSGTKSAPSDVTHRSVAGGEDTVVADGDPVPLPPATNAPHSASSASPTRPVAKCAFCTADARKHRRSSQGERSPGTLPTCHPRAPVPHRPALLHVLGEPLERLLRAQRRQRQLQEHHPGREGVEQVWGVLPPQHLADRGVRLGAPASRPPQRSSGGVRAWNLSRRGAVA